MKILYIGSPETYILYKAGKVPSHWLYGAIEMENDGHTVYWEKGKITSILNDIRLLKSRKPDIIFIPNLNLKAHLLLLSLKSLGIIRTPIYAYIHHSPIAHNLISRLIYKFLYNGINHIFFLSEKSMYETINGKFKKKEKCSMPYWGGDMDFYSKYRNSENDGYFISTGKENRDFDILIEAFSQTKEKLKIITCRSHAGRDYSKLQDKCRNLSNIEVIITENNGNVYPMMIKEMAKAKAIVCPLIKENLTYCVGLSTITDAEGLCKPLIITANPYHENKRTEKFNVVENINEWVDAITNLKTDYTRNHDNISNCYKNMKKIIFNN